MKRRLLLATTNRGKVAEFRDLLGGTWELLVPGEGELCAKAVPDVVEDGTTYYENSLKKAVAFQKVYGLPVLADDSGLEVDCLDGAPGLYSARFGGVDISWPQRWEVLYKALSPFPRERWTGRFRAVLCYFEGRTAPKFFEGLCEGRIHPQPEGGKGFGYDPIFFVDGLGKTFGQASSEEKNRASHRALAVRAFLSDLGS